MATELNIDPSRNTAYIKVTGCPSSRDILNAFDLAVSAEDYAEGMGRVWDFTKVDLGSLDSDTVREMAKYSLGFPPGIRDVKVAFVVTEAMAYGLTRMFQSYSDNYAETKVRLFKDVASAEDWMIEGFDR